MPKLMNHLLGTKFKIVKGYKGGAAINKAMAQGEVQGRMNYWTGWTTVKKDWLAQGKLFHLIQYGPRIAALKDVPSMVDLVSSEEGKKMVRFIEVSELIGMGFWVAPGVPKDRVAALRSSFMATMKDPAFLADAKKRRAPVAPIAGARARPDRRRGTQRLAGTGQEDEGGLRLQVGRASQNNGRVKQPARSVILFPATSAGSISTPNPDRIDMDQFGYTVQ